jgi:hypothetical protein
MHQQGAGRVLPGWVSVGRDCDGGYGGGGEGSGRDDYLAGGWWLMARLSGRVLFLECGPLFKKFKS